MKTHNYNSSGFMNYHERLVESFKRRKNEMDLTYPNNEKIIYQRKRQYIVQLIICIVYLLTLSCLILTKKNKNQKNYILVYSITQSQHGNNIKSLTEFLREPRFEFPINSYFVIENRRKKSLQFCREGVFTFDIPLYLYRKEFTFLQKLQLIKKITLKCKKIANKTNFRNLGNSLIEYLIYDEIYDNLNLNSKTKFVTTQSSAFVQPLPFYLNKFQESEKIMLWYSANNILIPKINASYSSDQSSDYWIEKARIDKHFVWTQKESERISRFTKSEVISVGSILFVPKNFNQSKSKNNKFKIIVCDVTPRKGEYQNGYYSDEVMIDFINDILKSVESHNHSKFEIVLKVKRKFSSSRSTKYINHIKYLLKNNKIKIITSTENIYTLFSSFDLCISIPYTSTGIVSSEMGIKNIYYSPEKGNQFRLANDYEGIKILKGLQELDDFIGRLLNDNFIA